MARRKSEEKSLTGGSQTARLPRLRQEAVKPNFNRRAQEIIQAHMYEDPGDDRRARAAPLLQMIDGTAPRTARSHDISHLQDGSGTLRPTIPPSLMKESDFVYESSFFPKDVTSVYRDQDGLWHTLVFPSDQPSSRADAVHLNEWITRSLADQDETQSRQHRSPEELVDVLSVAIREVSRQVTHHCVERGQALDRIWKTYVELFDRVMHQMRSLLSTQRRRTGQAQERLTLLREELKGLRKTHPEDMHKVISTLEDKFSEEQKILEEKLKKAQESGAKLKGELRVQYKEIEAWFPLFGLYQDAPLKNQLSFMGQGRGSAAVAKRQTMSAKVAEGGDGVSPDVAIAEDFKRLLSAINPDRRKEMGQELAAVMEVAPPGQAGRQQAAQEPDVSGTTSEVAQSRHAKQKAMEALQEEIRGQEERIRQLRREIVAVETGVGSEQPADQQEDGGAPGADANAEKGVKKKKTTLKGGSEGSDSDGESDADSDSSGAANLIASVQARGFGITSEALARHSHQIQQD